MKECYVAPEVEIIEFDTDDVIVSSNSTNSSNEGIVLPSIKL